MPSYSIFKSTKSHYVIKFGNLKGMNLMYVSDLNQLYALFYGKICEKSIGSHMLHVFRLWFICRMRNIGVAQC